MISNNTTRSSEGRVGDPQSKFHWLVPTAPPMSLVFDPWTTVDEARRSFFEHGLGAAVIMERGRPIGVLTTHALRGRPGRVPSPDAMVADVMDFEVVGIDPEADAHHTLTAYTNAAWASLRRRRPLHPESAMRRAHVFRRTAETRAPDVALPGS